MSETAGGDHLKRRGLLVVLSSPSGAGKTTLSRRLLQRDPAITMSVSVTTRSKRQGEIEGRDYYFISRERFEAMRRGGELLESAEVFGNGYGTPRKAVEASLAVGRDVLFDIDWQGTQQIHQVLGDDLVRIFILPPSVAALRTRLRQRALDAAEVIAKRMAEAATEISHWAEYDYVLINEDVDECERDIVKILHAERLKRHRRIGLFEFTEALKREL